MTREDIRSRVIAILGSIAPETDFNELDPSADLREEADLDSMDLLNFATKLSKELGVDVPQADERNLVTLGSCVDYFAKRCGV